MSKVPLFLFIASFFPVSENDLTHIVTIPCHANMVTTDNLGNLYTVNEYEIRKYNLSGTLLYSFSDKRYGKITFTDASNPMKILVFYKEFSTLLFLDNTLNINGGPVYLPDIGMLHPVLACTSYENGFWVFDRASSQLHRFNPALSTSAHSSDLGQMPDIVLSPDFLTESNNRLYMGNPGTGIMVFDIFGTYNKTIPPGISGDFQVAGDMLYYLNRDSLKAYNMKSFEEQAYALPVGNVIAFRIENPAGGGLYLLTGGSIEIYRFR